MVNLIGDTAAMIGVPAKVASVATKAITVVKVMTKVKATARSANRIVTITKSGGTAEVTLDTVDTITAKWTTAEWGTDPNRVSTIVVLVSSLASDAAVSSNHPRWKSKGAC